MTHESTMLAIEFEFESGRFHATPWDRSPNEGVPEWPPSPWRVVRALVATWYDRAPELDPQLVSGVVDALSSALPAWTLPGGVEAHLRHYMPVREGRSQRQAKILDPFVHLARPARVTAVWEDVELSPEELATLDTLLDRLSYLGRAESWVRARRTDVSPAAINCRPLGQGAAPDGASATVRLLAPLTPSQWARLREDEVPARSESARAPQPNGRKPGKKALEKKLAAIESAFPERLLDAVSVSTAELNAAGWSQPPASRYVEYARPADALRVRIASRPVPDLPVLPTLARFAVASRVRPRITDVHSVAHRLHDALVHHSDGKLAVFSGRNPDGSPMTGGRHAWLHGESWDGSGRLTHLTVHAPMGFDASARAVLSRVERLWGRDGFDVYLALIGIGTVCQMSDGVPDTGRSPLGAKATVWTSITPFIPVRHPKRTRAGAPKLDDAGRQIGSPEHDLLRLLALRPELPPVVELATSPGAPIGGRPGGGEPIPWHRFHTTPPQATHGTRAARTGFGFTITFASPVAGPLAVGYGAHTGLGLFAPDGVFR